MILGIFGAGGLGREVKLIAEAINHDCQRWNDIVFIDDAQNRKEDSLSFIDFAKKYIKLEIEIVIAIGEPFIRQKLIERVDSNHIKFASLIHPLVYIPDSTTIGLGTVINTGCFISCNTEIGNNVYVHPNSNIGHDCKIEDNVTISGLVNIAGGVHIKRNTYIGMSAIIRENTIVGSDCIIGMGSVIMKDFENGVVVMGNPGRIFSRNSENKVFK